MSTSTVSNIESTTTTRHELRQAIWRGFTHSLSGFDSEHRVTMGVVFGMICGLLPKDSLLAYLFLGLMVLSLANLLSGILSVAVFSALSPLLDRWADSLGFWVLTQPTLQEPLRALMEMPLLPWLRFNNTVVMGQFLVGLALVYPVYWITYRVYARIKPSLIRWFAKNRSTRWLVRDNP